PDLPVARRRHPRSAGAARAGRRPRRTAGPPPARCRSALDRLAPAQAVLDRDPAGPRLLQHGDADGQYAIVVGGLDTVGVEVVGETDPAGEGAHPPLTDERALAVADLLLAVRGDRQDVAVDGHLDRVGVDAGQVEPQDDVLGAPDAVHRHGRAVAVEARLAEHPVYLSLELLHERIERRQQHDASPPYAHPGPSGPGHLTAARKSTTYFIGSLQLEC